MHLPEFDACPVQCTRPAPRALDASKFSVCAMHWICLTSLEKSKCAFINP